MLMVTMRFTWRMRSWRHPSARARKARIRNGAGNHDNEDHDILKIVTMKIMAWKMEIMTMKTCFSNKLVHEPPKRWTWADGLQWWRSSPPSTHNHHNQHDHPNTDDNSKRESSQGQAHRVPSLLVVRVTLGQHAHPWSPWGWQWWWWWWMMAIPDMVMMVMDDGDDGDYGEMEVNNCKTWDTGAWWADALESSCKKQYCVTPAKCEYWKGNMYCI